MHRSLLTKRLGGTLLPLGTLLTLALAAGAPAAAGAQDRAALRDALRAHRWKHRVLVVVAPAPDLPAYRDQVARLADAADELRARDVRVLTLLGAPASGAPAPGAPSAGAAAPGVPADLALAPLPAARERAVRRQLGAAGGDFRVVLVGKDGGAKLDRRAPLAVATLVETIDAMPMGAEEARRRRRGTGRG